MKTLGDWIRKNRLIKGDWDKKMTQAQERYMRNHENYKKEWICDETWPEKEVYDWFETGGIFEETKEL